MGQEGPNEVVNQGNKRHTKAIIETDSFVSEKERRTDYLLFQIFCFIGTR